MPGEMVFTDNSEYLSNLEKQVLSATEKPEAKGEVKQ
jgi:hypothetical protein